MAYKPVKNISFSQKKHRQLLWVINELAKARREEAAVTAQKLIMQAGNKEMERLGINSVTSF